MFFYIILIIVMYFYINIFFNSKICFKKLPPKLPGYLYKLFYTDENLNDKYKDVIYSKVLYSKKYDIKGKPDYIYKHKIKNILLPVELKSASMRNCMSPKKNDLMQLAVYFLIIEDVYKIKPKKGYLIYKDCMFVIKNSKYLKKEVLNTLNKMRSMILKCNEKSNKSFLKCNYCIYKNTVCRYWIN